MSSNIYQIWYFIRGGYLVRLLESAREQEIVAHRDQLIRKIGKSGRYNTNLPEIYEYEEMFKPYLRKNWSRATKFR